MNSDRHGDDSTEPSAPPRGTPEVSVHLDGVAKTYPDGTVAVADLTLDAYRGQVLALVGPSGCGKSTILRMVNRLVEPTSGRVLLDGADVSEVDPVLLRRRIGYVIQASGLFPHQRVRRNVMTVPLLLGWGKARASERADEVLDLVGLDPDTFARRYPHELSGGQQQRVGVARALAARPDVLVMDEPFGAVDPVQRSRLQQQFRELQGRLGTTVLLVTHDVDEAILLADRIAVLSTGGRLEQVDTPAALLADPANERVSDLLGADRSLRRLAVTGVDVADLEQPPVLAPSLSDGAARDALAGCPYGVVVDEAGVLLGWRSGAETPALRPVPATVERTDSLRRALAELVQQDAGWIAVLDGERYLGVLTFDSLHAASRR